MNQYQAQLQNWQNEQAQQSQMFGSMGTLGGAALGLALAPFTGGMSMAIPLMSMGAGLGGTASSLFGGSGGMNLGQGAQLASSYWPTSTVPSGVDLSGLISSLYNPSWMNTKLGSQLYNLG